MNCPVRTVPLTMDGRQGAGIDARPRCRGVWLDRGEPDEIVERSAGPRPTVSGRTSTQDGAKPDRIGRVAANSELREAGTHGVLELTLRRTGYAWRFVPVAGRSFTDAGTGACH